MPCSPRKETQEREKKKERDRVEEGEEEPKRIEKKLTEYFLAFSLAPYERRVIELLRNSKDKRARKLAKKRVCAFSIRAGHAQPKLTRILPRKSSVPLAVPRRRSMSCSASSPSPVVLTKRHLLVSYSAGKDQNFGMGWSTRTRLESVRFGTDRFSRRTASTGSMREKTKSLHQRDSYCAFWGNGVERFYIPSTIYHGVE